MCYQECNLGENRPYLEVMDGFLPKLEDYYQNPEKHNIDPFRMFGNLYYVGDKKVCMHLLDTGEGCILFDSGYSHNYPSLVKSIETLGFDPHDIRYVIHSHGHFDHFGGGDRLREEYGAKILMSKVDTELLREMPERALLQLAPGKDDRICWPDETISDGDVIALGNTKVRCVAAPGHTPGTMACFFEAQDENEAHRVGYLGGLGFLSIYKEFCRRYRLPETMCDELKATAEKLCDEDVEIVLGNHPNHKCLIEKREYMLCHPDVNPFINKEAWRILLTAVRERCIDFERRGY